MPGQVGYPDWRRRSDYDSDTFVLNPPAGTVRGGAVTYGPFFVGDMSHLALFSTLAPGRQLQYQVTWFTDQGLTHQVGFREFWRSTAYVRIVLPNLARWVTIDITPQTGAGNWTDDLVAFGTNRPALVEGIPYFPLLANVAVTLNAGATSTLVMYQVFSGGVTLSGRGDGGGAWAAYIYALMSAGSTSAFEIGRVENAASVAQSARLDLPLTECQLTLANNSNAVQTVRAVVSPSTAGGG